MTPMALYLLMVCLSVFLTGAAAFAGEPGTIKPPNVAGTFYPADQAQLSGLIDRFMAAANVAAVPGEIQVAIAPHAGYVFSGLVAADAFKAAAGQAYATVVVIGPSHFYPFKGASIWSAGGMQTPLGTLPVDEPFARALMAAAPLLQDLPAAFDKEHAVEAELPFIQKTFPHAKIVPIVMGQPDFAGCEQLAAALNKVIGTRRDVLVLISSDMSHYLPAADNDARDARTLTALRAQDIEGFWDGNARGTMEMCGFVPAAVAMMLAKLRGLTPRVLAHANSGDAGGGKDRVVGYGAVVFYKPAPEGGLSTGERTYLVSLARQTLRAYLKDGRREQVHTDDPRLKQVQGAFVTLTKGGQLRGCIGNITGDKPLAETVRDMAIAAASQDPRFPPVTPAELPSLHVEISVLSVPQRIPDASAVVLGRDGVIVSGSGGRQGVFLPQVASETGWSKERFLDELCTQKAGLETGCWKDPGTFLYTFTAEVFGEE